MDGSKIHHLALLVLLSSSVMNFFFGALRYNEYPLVMTDTSHMSISMSFTASSGNLIQIMTF